ncbi:glyoxalase [Diplocloster hominis]|uniref:glyoxalase n=1 Tax=Diplocloster hominis TaxID=3079010 RepID=UPI0031BA4D95
MYEYDDECLATFLRKQSQLFDEPVAETLEEAEAFLEDCMAVVLDSLSDVREYFDENGMDIDGMSDDDLEDASEVFSLPNGKYLVVEG